MPSPPTSSDDLFFPSPPRNRSSLEDEVDRLIAKAQTVTTHSPAISSVLSTHKDIFLGVFGRQIQLLKSRSQAFEDAHVTVYDKTLLALTRNGNELETPAAIEFYCEEYLGIAPAGFGGKEILEHVMALPFLMSQGR